MASVRKQTHHNPYLGDGKNDLHCSIRRQVNKPTCVGRPLAPDILDPDTLDPVTLAMVEQQAHLEALEIL